MRSVAFSHQSFLDIVHLSDGLFFVWAVSHDFSRSIRRRACGPYFATHSGRTLCNLVGLVSSTALTLAPQDEQRRCSASTSKPTKHPHLQVVYRSARLALSQRRFRSASWHTLQLLRWWPWVFFLLSFAGAVLFLNPLIELRAFPDGRRTCWESAFVTRSVV